MRALLFVSVVVCVAAMLSTHVEAQNYPWCAYYSVKGGATNCGFTTYDQCMTTLSGMGGFCARNTQYVPPPGAYAGRSYYHRHLYHKRGHY